jgi:DNA-binding winged helix-turn-helix (wHTH) protein/Flp pilus assembly protein TadD
MRLLFGDCTFDADARTLQCGGESVRISGKAFQLLELLLAARPNPIPKNDLFAKLWPDTFVSDANLAGLVKELRAAIGDDARAPRFIRTVHRFGYAFSGAVTGRRPQDRYTGSAAYELYLKGRHHWNRRTAEGIQRAIGYFGEAIASDAAYAPAYSGLADCYIALASRDLDPPLQLMPKAEAAARMALELDAELAEGHASMAAIHEVFHWQWERAQESYLTALRLNPGYVTARQWYALALAHRGRFAEGLAQMQIAAESDPLSFMLNATIAVIHYLARAWDASEQHCHRALEINPHHEPAHFTLGLVQQQRGRFDDAVASLEKALAISKGEPHVVAALGALAAQRGDAEGARKRLAELAAASVTRDVSPVHFATVHVALGEHDRALEGLERGYAARSGWLVYLATEPRFDALRGDARFTGLVARLQSRDARETGPAAPPGDPGSSRLP